MKIMEIAQEKAQEYSNSGCSNGCYYKGFIDGAEYSIDKAADWLDLHLSEDEVIEFIKTMWGDEDS